MQREKEGEDVGRGQVRPFVYLFWTTAQVLALMLSVVTCFPSILLMSEPSSEPSTTSKLTAEFSYNVGWMADTFHSRSAVESLLGPQRAAGNISFHDYDAAMSFLPGYHRFYGVCAVPSW